MSKKNFRVQVAFNKHVSHETAALYSVNASVKKLRNSRLAKQCICNTNKLEIKIGLLE